MTKTERLEEFLGCSQCKRRVSGCCGPEEKRLPISTSWYFFSSNLQRWHQMPHWKGFKEKLLLYTMNSCHTLKNPNLISRDTIFCKFGSALNEVFYYIQRTFQSLRNQIFLKESLVSAVKIGSQGKDIRGQVFRTHLSGFCSNPKPFLPPKAGTSHWITFVRHLLSY